MSALLIIGHGTRDEAGTEEFRRFVRRVGIKCGTDAVAGGFIDLPEPSLQDAMAGLMNAGHRDVTAVPLLLLAAGEAKSDIPAALAQERERRPGLRTRHGRPIGVHPMLLDLLRERLTASAQPDPDAILLVGPGTTEADANADLYRAARLLWETAAKSGSGVEQVEPAFVSLTRPSVPEGLARLRALGARRVTVLPYFLFPGALPTRIHEQVEQYAAEQGHDQSALKLAVADVIGDCDALADLVLERYQEAQGRTGTAAK
jgi:sirohydrochlorin cobaltochelatase